ncbi:unnamed protein product [Orchesella dallaii]|uniref:Uncharacterized protein n=1 Tax=Orchesella dallaii TaxID=48710 RepID=A0ABP1R8D1_9HEXA
MTALQLRKNLLTKAKETKTIADIDESSQSTVGADGNDDVDLTLDFIIQEYEKLDLKEKDMEKVKLDVKRCLIALIREVGMLSIHKWIVSMQARQSSVAYKNYYEGDVSSNPEYKAARQQLGSKAGSILSGYIWKYVSTKKRQPVTFAMFYKLLGVKKGGFKKNPVEVFGSDFVNIANQVLRGRNKKIWRKTITLPDLPEFRAHFSCARFEGLNYDHVEIGTEVGEDLEDEADVGSLERVFPDSSRTLKLRLTRVDKEIQTITRSIKTHEMALEEDRKTLFDLVKEKSMLSDKIQEAEESEKLGQVSKDLFGSGVSAAQKIAKLSTFIRTSVRDATSEGRAKARTALIEFLDSEGERQNRKRKCTESGEEELLDIDCPPADMVEPKKNKKLKPSKESSKPSLEPKKPSTSTTAVAPKKKVDRKKLVKKADKKKRVAPKLKAVVETSEKILNDEEKEAEKVSNETAGKEIPSETSEKNGEQKLSKPEVLVVEEHETVGKSGGKPQPATNTEAVVSEVALVAEDVNNVSVESEAGSVSSDPSA